MFQGIIYIKEYIDRIKITRAISIIIIKGLVNFNRKIKFKSLKKI